MKIQINDTVKILKHYESTISMEFVLLLNKLQNRLPECKTEEGIKRFIKACDFICFELEFVDSKVIVRQIGYMEFELVTVTF